MKTFTEFITEKITIEEYKDYLDIEGLTISNCMKNNKWVEILNNLKNGKYSFYADDKVLRIDTFEKPIETINIYFKTNPALRKFNTEILWGNGIKS
jgi:hypothetical protein